MTTPPPAVYGQFGRTLAFAEQTMTAVLREHLAQRDTKPETWYALQLIATGGPGLDRETLTRDLERSRSLDAESARELLQRLAADGLISAGTNVELTAEGAAAHRGLRDYIAAPTIRLLSQFDIHDIETTVRTLQAITRRAQEEEEG
jgi:hypothetical protein